MARLALLSLAALAALAQPPQEAQRQADELVENFVTCFSNLTEICKTPSQKRPVAPQAFVLASWGKSGTTLTQQLIYQLLVLNGRVPTDPTGTDFYDASEVVPFIELATDATVRPLHAHEPPTLKTHSLADQFQAPQWAQAKFIVAVRDGRSAMRSLADYAIEWMGRRPVPAELRPAVYEGVFRSLMLGSGGPGGRGPAAEEMVGWIKHTHGWMQEPSVQGRVLFLIYEDVVKDMGAAVRAVAQFMGLELSEEVEAEVVRRCDRNYMVTQERFRSRLLAQRFGWDLSKGTRVRRADEKHEYTGAISAETERDWRQALKRAFGLESYAELCEELRAMNKKALAAAQQCGNESRSNESGFQCGLQCGLQCGGLKSGLA